MKKRFYLSCVLAFIFTGTISGEQGTRAKTMRNQTQRSPKSTPSAPPSYSPPSPSRPSYDPGPSRSNGSSQPRTEHSESPEPRGNKSEANTTELVDNCTQCKDVETPVDKQRKFENEADKKSHLTNNITVNSRIAFTNWDFHFSPAIQHQSTFFPTYEVDINVLGLDFSYLTALPPQPKDLFREIPIIDNTASGSLMEYLKLGATPLIFLENPLLKNLLAIEYRKTTKSTTITANQKLYYFPYTTYAGLTAQDSDLGLIFYEQKAAGSKLSYTIKERDWLFTIGIFALRLGYFDLSYSKPYQMDADIYQGNTLIDQRIYLFEGQAMGRGLMVGLQNLYFPNWDTKRFYFTTPDLLADGFFWGLKEAGFYWGTGSIRLQDNLDLAQKYRAFYQNETGHEPSVNFLRQVIHVVIGYKFNRHFIAFVEYRYSNYSLALRDSYSDDTFNYFLSHAINRDTVQQFAINLTVGF